MKDLIKNARAVEARLRELEYEMQEEAANTIATLCTELEAAQAKFDCPNMEALGLQAPTPKAYAEALRRRWDAKHKEELVAAQADTARIDFQQNNLAYEFTAEDDDGDLIWIAYKVTGSRNDREWHKVAEGPTLRQAIDAAIKAQEGKL